MPLYYFDLWNGRRVDFDDTGLEVDGPEAAFEEAVEGARDMLREAAPKHQDAYAWAYQVRAEAGKVLFTVPFSIAAADPHYTRARMSSGPLRARRGEQSRPHRHR